MNLVTAEFPLLSLLLLTTLAGALVTVVLPARLSRWGGLITALVNLLLTLVMVGVFENHISGFQLVEKLAWIPTLNIHYYLGIDGISLLFLPATALLFLLVILSSWNTVQTFRRAYFMLLLILELAIFGIFTSLDTILFFLFWEMTLIPLYFLTTLWGVGPNRRFAGTKYTLVMMVGGVPLLLAFLVLAIQPDGQYLFDYPALLGNSAEHTHQHIIFLLLLLGFAVKTPLVPLHTWLPVLALEGQPNSIATIVGLKLGAYGLLRYALPLAPESALQYQWLLLGLGTIGVIYGALLALQQSNLRRMLAYASISHVGMVIIGLATFHSSGVQGAIFQLLNFTFIASALFLITGFIYQRVGSSDIISLGGLAQSMPLLTAFYLFLGLASLGIPGTSGFPAELLIFIATLKTFTGVGLAMLASLVITAAYFLTSYRAAFLGQANRPVIINAQDLKHRELIILLIVSLITLLLGIHPQPVLDLIAGGIENLTIGGWSIQ